jgi:hypothetical protein
MRSWNRFGRWTQVLSMAVALLASVAHAAPYVTLKLEKVTLAEALLALQRAIHYRCTIEGSPVSPQAGGDAAAPRASFDWNNAPLGRVSRDLEAAFRHSARWNGPRTIDFSPTAPHQRESPFAVRHEGITLAATRLEWYTSINTSVDLKGAQPKPTRHANSGGTLTLAARPDDGDTDLVYGVAGVRVMTDRGPAGVPHEQIFTPGQVGPDPPRLDEALIPIHIGELPPGARRITRLSGELLLSRRAEWTPLEIPISGARLPLRRNVGGAELVVTKLERTPEGELSLEYSLHWRGSETLAAPDDRSFNPVWRLRSGEIGHLGGSTSISGSSDGERHSRGVQVRLGPHEGNMDNPPVAALLEIIVRAEPSRRIPFRIEGIPLPAGVAPERGAAPGVPLTQKPAVTSPRSKPPVPSPQPRATTGSIVSPVLQNGKPAVRGELAIGLSRRQPDGAWGPIRWQDVVTDDRGLARVDDLAPGVYQVRRSFRPRNGRGSVAANAGGARGSESGAVTARVRAGQSVTLPVLRWDDPPNPPKGR